MMPTRPGYIWSGTEWVDIGSPVSPIKYQATAPTTPSTGDLWIESDVDVPSVDSALLLRWRKTMAGGETSLSGNDDNALPLTYTPGYEQLYINGVLQVRTLDYTATTGNTITGLTALVANDVVEIFSALAYNVANVYNQTQSDARFVNRNVGGLNLIIPTGATGGTVSANGAVTIGSAVSSVTVSGAFSAAYDNYKIIVSGGVGSTSNYMSLKLGSSSTGYYNSGVYATYVSTTPVGFSYANQASWAQVGYLSTSTINLSADLLNPFLTKNTIMNSLLVQTTTVGLAAPNNGWLNDTTSYTDFTITPAAGTLTGGTIRIYGYNNGA